MKKVLLILASIITLNCLAQSKATEFVSFSCGEVLKAGDVEKALNAGPTKKITVKCSPKGAGNHEEVSSGKKKDKYYFEKEHNVIWIKFTAIDNGELCFDIKPREEKDDYDFLLFHINETTAAIKDIKSKKLKPIRSNLSRNNTENKSITGLSLGASDKNVASGLNNEYSKSIKVKRGERFYLALDNVYDEGEGVIIQFKLFATKKIKGIIKNDDGEIVNDAEITWEDAKTGEVLAETKTNPETGKYEFEVPYDAGAIKQKYVLSAFSEKHFFSEESYTPEEVKDFTLKSINMMLPSLKKGKKGKVHNINFVGGEPTLLKSAYPSLERLHRLLKKNKTLKIVIEGHTNGCPFGVADSQKLSYRRSQTVKTYLTEHGIKENRLETKGYNCQYMLYPNPINEKQHSLNRRVEILVTDL